MTRSHYGNLRANLLLRTKFGPFDLGSLFALLIVCRLIILVDYEIPLFDNVEVIALPLVLPVDDFPIFVGASLEGKQKHIKQLFVEPLEAGTVLEINHALESLFPVCHGDGNLVVVFEEDCDDAGLLAEGIIDSGSALDDTAFTKDNKIGVLDHLCDAKVEEDSTCGV